MSKPLDRLTLLETFVRIADSGSISAAARELGLSQPSASRQLAELEQRLKTQLVRRNTHSLSLTQSGIELLVDAKSLIDSWERLEEKYLQSEEVVKGKLKVIAPVAIGQLQLADLVWRFQSTYPQVEVSWQLEDRPIKFTEEGADCWIKIGSIPDDTLVSKPIGSVERLLVGSRKYLEGKTYRTPSQVEKLDMLVLEPFEGKVIPISTKSGKTLKIKPKPKTTTNNIFALKAAVMNGLGIAVLPKWFISDDLVAGDLIDVLPRWRAPKLKINIGFLPGRHRPKRLQCFVEMLEKEFSNISGIESP